jgi:hypothetical protein
MKQIQFEKVTLNDNQERQKIGNQKKKEKNITKKKHYSYPLPHAPSTQTNQPTRIPPQTNASSVLIELRIYNVSENVHTGEGPYINELIMF